MTKKELLLQIKNDSNLNLLEALSKMDNSLRLEMMLYFFNEMMRLRRRSTWKADINTKLREDYKRLSKRHIKTSQENQSLRCDIRKAKSALKSKETVQELRQKVVQLELEVALANSRMKQRYFSILQGLEFFVTEPINPEALSLISGIHAN